MKRCPSCRGEKIVPIEVVTSQGIGYGLRPKQCPTSRAGLAPREPFASCLSCGLVWSALDPAVLRAYIEASGPELARQHLDELDHGPFRDLPDTEIGRSIGAAISEIDALALAGSTAAIRRYRELRGVTWDQAILDMTSWSRLTRDQKLELFGWVPKKKPALDDFDCPFP